MLKKSKVNKSKEEIIAQTKHLERVKWEKTIAKLLFPFMAEMKTIYDAQTVLNATAGYINLELQKKLTEIKVSDLEVDISSEPESEVKSVMLKFLGQLETEKAKDVIDFLERYGKGLGQYASAEYLKNPMSIIKVTDLVKD